MRTPLAVRGIIILFAWMTALLTGCGAGTDLKGTYHPAGWLAEHPGKALADLDHCKTCHEMTVLKVGSSLPNCMTAACHHGTLPGFQAPGSHGLRAKARQDATGGGLASCQVCHGRAFDGGGAAVACFSCHGVAAPHPPKPWRDTAGLTHADTDPSNAPVCAQCHLAGSPLNPAGHPATPAPAGTVPTCFNQTLCHGPEAPHPLGAVWRYATSAAFHGLQAKQDLLACQACHGQPGTPQFAGGSAPTACASCHTAAGAHSGTWYPAPVETFPGYVPSHRDARNRDNACPVCHDYTRGRTAPLPAAPSCFAGSRNAVACHADGPGQPDHPVPFPGTDHTAVTQAGFTGRCGACHALAGASPVTAAPACSACHQAGSPLAVGACASCHERPPQGQAFPDLAGAHAKHDALAQVAGTCDTCHLGAGTGTAAHYTHANGRPGMDGQRAFPAPVAFLAAYNGKAGAAAMDPATQTCSNVSCHGGVATPAWGAGRIDVATGCASCHVAGTSQYNAYVSGKHATHLGGEVRAACTDCHAMANGTPGAANHFAHLDTAAMEGPASDTIQYLGSRAVYNPVTRTCTLTCHGEFHNARTW